MSIDMSELEMDLGDVVDTVAEESTESGADPRDQIEYSFDVEFKDKRGKVWKGRFTNKILNIKEQRQRGVVAARLAADTSWDSLDPMTRGLLQMLAHLQISLVRRPKWAMDLQELQDLHLLNAIYEEVQGHESYYFRLDANTGEGQEE